jgi:uncharacterized membrane protein
MGEIYRAPALTEEVRRWLRIYGVKYVFVGAIERRLFGPTLAKFEELPKLYTNAGATVYAVP